MSNLFHGSNLRLARLYSDKTQSEVAELLEVSRQFVHRLESGQNYPSDDQLLKLAAYLNVKSAFFFKLVPNQVGEHQCHFRKLRSTKVGTRNRVVVMSEIYRQLIHFIDNKLQLPIINIPEAPANSANEIERSAERTRAHWGLGLGPIDNITRVLENAGVPVTFFKSVSGEIDALAVSASRPMIIRNDFKVSPGRLRYDLAHECGHLVMHEGKITGDRITENEANRFASAFLMPRSTFLSAFPVMHRIKWKDLHDLKFYFKVSKAALLYRAKQLERITDSQYKNAFIRLKKHEGKHEKDDHLIGEIEQPELINDALNLLWEHYGIGFSEIEKTLNLMPNALIPILGHYNAPKAAQGNVISFKPQRTS